MIPFTLARNARILLALVATLALLAPAAPIRAAASFTFSNPRTTSTFNSAVDFSIDLDSADAPSRVELWITFPGALGPDVVQPEESPASGTSHLHYTLATSGDGHLMPNTPISSQWVAYGSNGDEVHSDATSYRYLDDTQQWRNLSDGIVTVHWTAGPDSFAEKAASVAVKAIAKDATLLGIDETAPADFFIYADDASFRAAMGPGTRENVGGRAITDTRTLYAELTPEMLDLPWVNVVITHELTHQVSHDAIANPYRSLPRWLDEGFAVYQSEGDTPGDRAQVRDAVASGDLLPLTALGWEFPTDPQRTALAYAESVSAVDHIARTYGMDGLVKLVLAYKNGPTDDEALTAAIGKDMATFQAEWYQAIGASAPSQFGPKPAPSGPLPSDWTAPAASQGPSASSAAGASASPEAAASTPSPAASPATTPASSDGGGSGGDLVLVLVALVVVAGAVLAGIVLAGRRAASP